MALHHSRDESSNVSTSKSPVQMDEGDAVGRNLMGAGGNVVAGKQHTLKTRNDQPVRDGRVGVMRGDNYGPAQ